MRLNKLQYFVLLMLMFFLAPSTFISASDLIVKDVGVSNAYYIALDESLLPFFLVSFSDNNKAWIYSLDDGIIKQETEVTLEALVPYHYIPAGLYIKIVSEQPIMVYMIGLEGGYGGTHYPSVSGEFVGKNFIVFPLPSDEETVLPTLEIWPLETGLVEIKNGTELFTIPVFEDLYLKFDLQISEEDKHKIYYNITSTAKIMLSTGIRDGWLTGPTITGFVGKVHYGNTRGLLEPGLGGVEITAFEPGIVSVTNLTDGSIMTTLEFTQAGEILVKVGGKTVDYMSDHTPIKVEGEIDTFVRIGCGSGSPYMGGRVIEGDQIEYWQYIGETPAGTGSPAVIFAPEDVTFTLNGTEVSLKADEYMILDTANKNYHIISPKPLVVQSSIGNRGYLIAPSGIPVTRPEVTEEETPPPDNTMIYVAIAVAVILVVAVLGYFLSRKKS